MYEKKGLKKLRNFIGGAALVTLSIFGCAGLTGCGNTAIDLTKYVTISSSGYDGLGGARAEFDTEKFEADYGKKIKVSDSKNEEVKLAKALGATDIEIFEDSFSGSLDKSGDLSNGDVLTYTITLDDDFATIFKGYTVKNLSMTYEVAGLGHVEKFDPFAEISVSFSGDNQSREMRISKPSNEMWDNIKFKISYTTPNGKTETPSSLYVGSYPTVKCAAGSKINITLTYGDTTSFIEKYNKIPQVNEKEYTVSSFAEYPTTISGISKNYVEALTADGKSIVENKLKTNNYAKNVKVEYVGSYYLSTTTGKTASIGWGYSYMNRYYCVYKVTQDIVVSNVSYGTATYYKAIYYNDIEKDNAGNYGYEDTSENYKSITCGINDLPYGASLSGYESLDDIDKVVNELSDEMKVEKNY